MDAVRILAADAGWLQTLWLHLQQEVVETPWRDWRGFWLKSVFDNRFFVCYFLPLLPIPILPEHVWSSIPDDQIKSYANEPKNGVAPVGSGPFPARRRDRRRLDLHVRRQQELLGRRSM